MIQVVDSKSFPYLKKRKKDIKNTLVSSARGRAEEERGYKEKRPGDGTGHQAGQGPQKGTPGKPPAGTASQTGRAEGRPDLGGGRT